LAPKDERYNPNDVMNPVSGARDEARAQNAPKTRFGRADDIAAVSRLVVGVFPHAAFL
jgi:hypothetical protein